MNKTRRTNQHSQRGMTLIEVIVATSIFIVILLAAMMIYDQSNKMFKTSVESADLQQNTRAGFDRLVADVRMAGFDADRDGVPVRAPAGPWSPNTTFATGTVISPTSANSRSYRAVTGGTTGALEPAWPTTPGSTLSTDGTVTWITIGPAYQQPDEQIEFAGRSAITLRGNLDYNIVSEANPHHGREIEYEPTGGQFPIVTTANDEIVTYALRSVNGPNPDTLRFFADVAKPRSVYPGGSPEAEVTITNVDLCASGCNNPPYTLMRFTLDENGNPDAGTPVANNVRNLEFFYYQDGAGTELLETLDEEVIGDHGAVGGDGQYNPANVGGTTNWDDRAVRGKIAAVRVRLVGMNEQPDRRYINPTETLPSAQNYRTYNLESLVTPRNLGLSGMAEPDTKPPGPPTVTSVCVGSCNITRVRWNPPITANVETYEVRYDTNPSGAFNSIGVVVPGDVVSAPVFGLVPGTNYFFKVVAINENGRRISDNSLSRAPINSTRPGPVANLVVTAGENAQQNKITLSFTTPMNNDPALASMSCQGLTQDGSLIDPAETIRYRIWRGTTIDFNPVTNPASAEIVLDNTVSSTLQPNGTPGAQIIWIDDLQNARIKPPANCKPYFYRVQVYDTCSLAPTTNNPALASTGESSIFPFADATSVEDAIEGYASSDVVPSAPHPVAIDYSGSNSRCNRGLNTCDVKITWDAVRTDTSNPTEMITIDQYRISRERKKASDTAWVFDTILPVVTNASSDPQYMEGADTVVYHDTTALDHDPNDRRKWYYRYTITALQCGVSSAASTPVQFPASCNLAESTIIESGASAGDGSLAAPWVMGANDNIQVVPPEDQELNEVEFEVFPEPDPNPNNAALMRQTVTGEPFIFNWENQSDGQVYRVVITMRNAAGCTEQAERFIQDDPINCASSTITATGSSGGSGTDPLPWIMGANQGDKLTVNAPSGSPIATVTFALFNNPGNSVAAAPVTDIVTPFEYPWPLSLIDNQEYRLEMTVNYADGCSEVLTRFIVEEPPPVCSGATIVASGASSGAGTLLSPWVLNGGDALTITPPVNGIVNQVVFTLTPVSPAGGPLPVITDSSAPYALAWTDTTIDKTVYKVDAAITYSTGCTETLTRYVKDEVCSGAVVSQTGSTGAGTGLTTASPWVFNANDVVTVTPPAGETFTNVVFSLYNEPGTTLLSTSTDAATPYQSTWVNRVDDALYRLEILVTYTAGCTETIKRYIRDQGSCFITATGGTLTNQQNNGNQVDFATVTFTISNASNEVLTVKGIKVDWLRDTHPLAVIDQITYNGTTTQNVAAAAGAPPTTGVLTAPTVPTMAAGTSSYTIAVRFNLGPRADPATSNWINKLCIQYTAPSLGASPVSCNVLGSTTGNPGACN